MCSTSTVRNLTVYGHPLVKHTRSLYLGRGGNNVTCGVWGGRYRKYRVQTHHQHSFPAYLSDNAAAAV